MTRSGDPEKSIPIRDSGATGGAGTGRGVEYQTNLAVDLCLDLISCLQTQTPTQRPIIVIEPREVTSTEVTRWDIRTTPHNHAYEAKANPTKEDVLEWVRRVKMGISQNPKWTFELTVSDISNGYAKAMRKLLRLATEASQDPQRFERLCRVESDDALTQILEEIGNAHLAVANQMRLNQLPERALQDQIDFRLRYLVSPQHAASVREFLQSKFLLAMTRRQSFFVAELIKEIEQRGIRFHRPESVLPANMKEADHKAVFLLQRCPFGLPNDVIKDVCTGGSETDFRKMLGDLPDALISKDGLVRCSPLPVKLNHPNEAALLGSALHRILVFVKANRGSANCLGQVSNAIVIARACKDINPEAASELFGPLDKFFKRSGRKREVLDAAQITIDAAKKVTVRDERAVRAEAKALVCGLSWVHQRIGDLEKAEMYANESLSLGESIGWKRNTAFCQKCLGRLKRVQAGRCPDGRKSKRLLKESESLLREAVDTFSQCDEFGPKHEEVGDCLSLCGRTLLAMQRIVEAEDHATRARELIANENSKDYLDLLILEGELAAAKLDFSTADNKFSEAIGLLNPDDAEQSEIVARAFLTQGMNLRKWKGDRISSDELIKKAATIWENLGEHYCQSVAEWALVDASEEIPKQVLRRLRTLEPPVALEASRLWKDASRGVPGRTLSQRADMTDAAWTQVIKQARSNNAIRYRHW